MSFYRIFNLIYKLFSKRGLKVFLISLLIFLGGLYIGFNSESFAFTNYTINFSPVGGSAIYTLDNTNGFFDNYIYCIISSDQSGEYVFFVLSDEPFYKDDNISTSSGNKVFTTNGHIFFTGVGQPKNVDYVIHSSDNFSSDVNFVSFYVSHCVSNSVVYTDSSCVTGFSDVVVNSAFYSNDNSSSGGSDIDYSNILGHIDEQVTNTNTIVQDIATTTNSIDNRVAQIQGALVSQNSEVSNAVYNSASNTQNMILQGQIQSQNNFNTITNTTAYNSTDVYIDTSFNDITDINGVDNFIRIVINRLNTFFSGLNFDNSIELIIPIPFTNKTCTISTAPIQQFYSDNSVLAGIITMSWYFVFGVYIFRIAYTFWLSAVNGTILKDSEGFTAKIDDFGIIKFFMM